jgi:hypothetical protein
MVMIADCGPNDGDACFYIAAGRMEVEAHTLGQR